MEPLINNFPVKPSIKDPPHILPQTRKSSSIDTQYKMTSYKEDSLHNETIRTKMAMTSYKEDSLHNKDKNGNDLL